MFGNVRKCSENVRNGPGRSTNPPPGPATPVPNISRTISEHFSRNHHLEEGGNPPFPNMFRTCSKHFRVAPPPGGRLGERPRQFRTFSEHFRTFPKICRGGGATIQGARHPTIPNIFRTLLKEPPPRGEAGEAPPPPVPNIFRTFSSTSLTQCDIGPSPDQGPQQNYLVKRSPRVRRPVVGPLELTNLPTTRPSYP